MKEKLFNNFERKVHKQYFELKEKDNKLIFILKNSIPFFKNKLILKNRKTGKRISKDLKSSKAEIFMSELNEMGEYGYFDVYLEMNLLDKRIFLKRIRFVMENGGICLFDKNNHAILESYQSKYFNLSFKYKNAFFAPKANEIKKEDSNLIITGNIDLSEEINFDTVEILLKFGNNRKYIPCDFKRNGDVVEFKSNILFDVSEEELNYKYKLFIRLKENNIIIDHVRIKDNTKSVYTEIKDKYLDYIENFKPIDIENKSEICSLCYVNNDFNLVFNIINKNDIHKFIRNEERLFKFFSKKENKKLAFFESFHGKSYSGQPKYIYEKLLELGYDKYIDFIWSYEGDLEIPGEPLITMRNSNNYEDFLTDSDYWITNISFPILKENDETVYLQTTHGTPYKHMGSDISTNNKHIPKGRVLVESGTWNYLLSPNNFSKEIFKRAFEYGGKIINKGYPANDIFYKDQSDKINEIKKDLNIPQDKKIILYAPTFRDYDVDSKKQRQYNNLLDYESLYDNLSDEYVLIVRLHYLLSKNLNLSDKLSDFIIDLSDYDDIADLYLISDIMISDYSSAFFDYAHSKKPLLFFVPDYNKYNEFRGLYSEVKDLLPGPEIYTNEELINIIKDIDNVSMQYSEKYDAFYDKFCNLGHGNASEEVVKTVFGDAKNE